MEQLKKFTGFLGKYKYAALIVSLGIILMLLPGKQEKEQQIPAMPEETSAVSQAEALENILAEIEGVGRVKVLLTVESGAETLYQTDSDTQELSSRIQTVVITDAGRAESGLVRQVNPEKYLGAVIVCQGGASPAVCLHIIEAVSKATGLGTDRITVLKMK